MPRFREPAWDRWVDRAKAQYQYDQPDVVAFDTETTGVRFHDRPFAATVTWRGRDEALHSFYFELVGDGWERRRQALEHVLSSTDSWVAHNAKFDLQKLALLGIRPAHRHTIHDTQTIYYLLDENSPKALKKLAVSVLRWDDTIEVPYKTKGREGETRRVPAEEYRLGEARKRLGLTKNDGFHLLPRQAVIPYALRDTEFTLLLFEKLWPRLEKQGEALLGWYWQEVRLANEVLLNMEADGWAVDLDYLQGAVSEYGAKVMEGWQRLVELVGDPTFNPNSPKQIQAAFAARGIRLEDTQARTLGSVDDPLAVVLLQYREDKLLYDTYLRPLLDEQKDGPGDGIAHPNFNPTRAITGRMSSSSASE